MDSVSLPQNWYFLTFAERFLAARGHSLRNPDAFRSSVPAQYPMGASRILSAKKHSAKLSKYSALLYASSAHISFPPPSFRDSVYCHKAGFLSRLEPMGCGWLFFIGLRSVYFDRLCIIEDESLRLFLIAECKTNPVLKISCFTSLALRQSRPACHNPRVPPR